jgi:phosphohistidine phosphatase
VKTLYVLRHAKAEIGDATMQDFDRQLMERGERNAEALGAFLVKKKWVPEVVLCSPAARTRQTLERINDAMSPSLEADFRDRLYLASSDDILAEVQQLPDTCHSAMVIGHNPGLHQFCLLVSADGTKQALRDMAMKFPTCALAVLKLDRKSWGALAPATAHLEAFHDTHGLED